MAQRPRGTRDFGPAEMVRRLALERLFDGVASRHGFQRVQTPTFEALDLFTAKSGEAVVDQLYAFEDKGGRPLTLRPELTAPVMRMVASEMTHVPQPLRLAYFGNCFRYEEFKAGRYREFWQYGCEVVGASGPLVEAEVIAFAAALVSASGLTDWRLKVGHVGILREMLASVGLEGDAVGEVMRLIDKGDLDAVAGRVPAEMSAALSALAASDGSLQSIDEARSVLAGVGLGSESLDELRETLHHLRALAPTADVTIDMTVARGLDYYTGTVFEIEVDSLGGEGQVLGGGSYRLMHLFDKPDLDPCCGFGLGFDRVLLALAEQVASGGESVVDGAAGQGALAIVPFRIDAAEVLPLVAGLRTAGIDVLLELRSRKVQRSIHWAEARGAAHVLVVGPRDLESGHAKVKRLVDGAERDCTLDVDSVSAAVASLA